MALLMPIVTKKSVSTTTVTLKYDNHGVWQASLLTHDHGTRCAMGLIAYIEHKLDLTRPDEITRKHE